MSGGPRRGPLWRLTSRFTGRSRERRFGMFMATMKPTPADRILDVGVTDLTTRASNFFEARYPWPDSIVAIAPGPVPAFRATFPHVAFVRADGRDLPFADGEFDIGFSNAVIEHVGTREDQRRFVAEITRTCRRAFVCTPNSRFPVDPHTLLPFVHWLPRRLRHPLLRMTGNGLWATEEMLNPLSESALLALYPRDVPVRLIRQRMFGLTSVLIAVSGEPARGEPGKSDRDD